MREYEDEIDRMRARQGRKKTEKTAWKKETMKPVEDPGSFWLDEEDSDLEEVWLDEPDPEEDYWLEEEESKIIPQKQTHKKDWDDDLEVILLEETPSPRKTEKKSEIHVANFERKQTSVPKTPHRSKTVSGKKERGSMGKLPKKKKKKRRHWFRSLLIILFLFCGIFFLVQKKEDGFWTVAVFGVDSRDDNLEKGAHSDVIMLCSLNRASGEVKLVSVYRDTYLKTDKDGDYGKINSAYFNGGHEQAIEALEENLDLKIDDYATFSWAAVANAISALGGVDVEITDSEFEYINAFITETVESTGLGSVHLEQPGLNHLDGVQAVAYARLRLMDTDYKRTARQRLILSLTVEKAKQASFSTLSDLAMSVLPQTSTSIGISDILSLAKDIDRYYLGENTGFPFSRGDARINKQSCVIPLTLESNVVQLHQFLYGTENYVPSASVQKISKQIAADSGMGEAAPNAPEVSAGSSVDENHTSEPDSILQTEAPTELSTESAEETQAEQTEESESLSETTDSESTEEAEASSDSVEPPESDVANESMIGPSASPEETKETESHTPEDFGEGPGMNQIPDEESSSTIEIPNGPGDSVEQTEPESLSPAEGPNAAPN